MKTTRFGEITPKDTITLPNGVIGFPEWKHFTLIPTCDQRFQWLQSLDDGSAAFLIVNPLHFFPDYVVEALESEVSALDIQNESDVVLACIVTAGLTKATLNLKAPLVFNAAANTGCQIINPDHAFSTRHQIPAQDVAKAIGGSL